MYSGPPGGPDILTSLEPRAVHNAVRSKNADPVLRSIIIEIGAGACNYCFVVVVAGERGQVHRLSDDAPASRELQLSIAVRAERHGITASCVGVRADAFAIRGAPGTHLQEAAGVHTGHANLLQPSLRICRASLFQIPEIECWGMKLRTRNGPAFLNAKL